jgi:tetratricopeptide (TPR) repeat protein
LRRRRRRLLLASAPLVVLTALLGVRLVTLDPGHERTLAAYRSGDSAGTLEWGQRQGWVNVVERFRAPFAVGDGYALAGRFDLARTAFEEALALVPPGGVDECKIRVNLSLTYERLGAVAEARERPEEARQFYEKGIRVTKERPPVCDLPGGGQGTGSRLDGARERMQQQLAETGSDGRPDPGEGDVAQPSEPVDPTPNPGRTPSEQQQEQLRRQQRENTAERNQELGSDRQGVPAGETEGYPEPW